MTHTTLGTLAAYVRASFKSKVAYSEVLALTVDKVPAGARVRVTCDGRGCPYASESFVAAHAGSVDLAPRFRDHHLRVGDRITVTISDAGASRRYVYTIRSHRTSVAHPAS